MQFPDILVEGSIVQELLPDGCSMQSSDPDVLAVCEALDPNSQVPVVTVKALKPGKAVLTVTHTHEVSVVPRP